MQAALETVPAAEALPSCLDHPHVSLLGDVNVDMARQLIDALRNPPDQGDIAIEISTSGGDAELGRRMALEIDHARIRLGNRRLVFLGKTNVFSAGVTLMSAFPCQDRYLTRDAILLIHSRQLDKDLKLTGPIRFSLPTVRALCREIESGILLEEEGFQRLVAGSEVSVDEVREKAPGNWYVTAHQALDRRLVAGIYSGPHSARVTQ